MSNAPAATSDSIDAFIARWEKAEAAERANYQMFLTELCELLELPHPDPAGANNERNQYVFDRAITRSKPDGSSTTVWADLYKRSCFILETKQGANPVAATRDLRSLGEEGSSRLPEVLNKRQDAATTVAAASSRSADTKRQDAASTRKLGHGVRGTRQWDIALEKAYNQARGYIRDLPAPEGRPPFLIVCDVGYVIELYSEFTCTGGTYIRFPDPKNHRIHLEDLRDPAVRELLRTVWTDPLALDPSKHAARVTRDVAEHLARLAKSLEADGHQPEPIAVFLQRCLFTLFAEDVGLLPENAFIDLLQKLKDHPEAFALTAANLWKDMASEEAWSVALMQKIAYFNGGLFEHAAALPLSAGQIELLIGAARPDWSDVEPAIFGTLLERALSPQDRHKLGAHYTPRSYVERLVKPTVIDPLRSQWEAVKTAAAQFQEQGQADQAVAAVKEFHHHLCRVQVLDPACGSGNFLYVTLEHMKRLEGEVLELLEALGDAELTFEMEQFKVRPQQFHGLELNERAVAIAQLVLWIGYFQWHKKTTGTADTKDRPLLPKQQTILRQDAVLAYDEKTPRKRTVEATSVAFETEEYVCIWDGRTTKPHPVTGKEVPDESVTIPVYDYSNPRRAEWPTFKKDEPLYIVGNPPFIGNKRMRANLGDGYVESLRKVWKKDVPESADFVMFWWEQAAELVRQGKAERFGLITTNSIHQTFNRRVVEKHLNDPKKPLNLAYAIPDHPWVDTVDGAAVRIAMTVGTTENFLGELKDVTKETEIEDGEQSVELQTTLGKIASNLKIGADLNSTSKLESNKELSGQGIIVLGDGFILSAEDAKRIIDEEPKAKDLIRRYMNGSDLVRISRNLKIIDLNGFDETKLREYPSIYQKIYNTVRPKRLQMKDKQRREKWWLFGRTNQVLRNALNGLDRYIATCRTAKHRIFAFLDGDILPDAKIVAIGVDDSHLLGILTSVIHQAWAEAIGVRMGVGNDLNYNHADCFGKFPFPDLPEASPLKARLRELGEQLDTHRKKQQAAHPELTMTGMYNVLEKLRREQALNEKERKIHDDGLVSVLKQLHDEIDTATAEAYGWPDLSSSNGEDLKPLADRLAQGDENLEQQILQRLVDLNHARAAEEAQGKIRWLRPEYQDPDFEKRRSESGNLKGQQEELPSTETLQVSGLSPQPSAKQPWPSALPGQVAALRALLPETGPDPAALAAHFGKRTKKRVQEIDQILETLRNLGQL